MRQQKHIRNKLCFFFSWGNGRQRAEMSMQIHFTPSHKCQMRLEFLSS